MLIDLIASLSFYFIPYLTGRFFTKKIVQAFGIGALIWLVIYFATSFALNTFKIGDFATIIRFLVVIISIASALNIAYSFFKEKPKISLENGKLIGILVLFSTLIYFLVWKRNTPYPLQLNWDIYEHITLANYIAAGKLSFITSKISDTFTFASYSPIFGILLSIPKIIFGKSLLGIYWWLEYWHFLLTGIVSFLLAKKIFNNNPMALVSGIFSSLVFESVMVYSTLFLIPQTFVALFAAVIILEIKNYRKISLILLSILLILMHYVVGVLCIGILALVYIAQKFSIPGKALNILVFVATLISGFLVSLNFFGKWDLLVREEAAHFNFNIFEKLGFVTDWYGILAFALFIIGFLKIIKSGTYSQKVFLILTLLILGLSFAPFSYFLKFYVLEHYFVNLILVAGIGVFIIDLPLVLKAVSIAWITFVLLVTFYKNQLLYKDPLHFQNFETQISNEEIDAGRFLKSYNLNTYLISDPSLQYILEATSGVNTQGGAYMDNATRKDLININGSSDGLFIKNKLLSVTDLVSKKNPNKKTLFAVGGRYFAWQDLSNEQKMSTFYNIWSPVEMTETDRKYVNFLKQSGQFKTVFENDQVVIFEIL